MAVEVPSLADHLADGIDFLHWGPGTLSANGNDGLPEVEHIRGQRVFQAFPSAHLVKPEEGHQQRTSDEHHHLDRLGVGHRAHATQRGVETGQEQEREASHPEAVQVDEAQVQVHFREKEAEHHATGEDAHGHLGEHVEHQRHQREGQARGRAEPLLQEFRHGVDAGAHIEGHQHPGQHQQTPGVQLIVRHGHAIGGARTRQSHHVLRANVGGEDGRANDPPFQMAARQEVVIRRIRILADHPPAHTDQDCEIDGDDTPIQRLQQAGCHCQWRKRKGAESQ